MLLVFRLGSGHVEDLSSYWVNLAVVKTTQASVKALVELADETGRDLPCLKGKELVLVHREAGNHPPVDFAISLLHPFNDSTGEHVIRDSLSLIDTHAHGMISLELLVHQFRRVDTDEAELLSDALSL